MSRVRDDQVRATRARIVDAARTLLLGRGYAGTTMSAVAQEAGVSLQTVYNSVGSKAKLVKRVWDVTLVGDDEPVPFGDRPEARALDAAPDGRTFLAAYAALGRLLVSRLLPLGTVLVEGAGTGDPELRALLDALDRERLSGATDVAQHLATRGWLREDVTVERARDAVWTLDSLDVALLLLRERGWTADAYERWLGEAMAAATLPWAELAEDPTVRPRAGRARTARSRSRS